MIKLSSLYLENFAGYENCHFTFSLNTPMNLFFGPNGIGKSSVLEAVRIISNPQVFNNRQQSASTYLRNLVYDAEFNPLSDQVLSKAKEEMLVEGTFYTDSGFKKVVLNNDGFVCNELEDVHYGHAFYVDADNPMNWNNFQLISNHADKFIELAEFIYGFECDLDGEVFDTIEEADGTKSKHLYYQDLIVKKGNTKVHYARMSAGEKKIATLVRMLCNPDNINRDIILIDNIEQGIYFKRHRRMLDKLCEYLKGKQIIATTHSCEMIDHCDAKGRFDLEKYKPEYKNMETETEKETVKTGATPELVKLASERVSVELDSGIVVQCPPSMLEMQSFYDDNGNLEGQYRRIDALIANAITFDDNGKEVDPVPHEFRATLGGKCVDELVRDREMKRKALLPILDADITPESKRGLLRKLKDAVYGWSIGWRSGLK